MNRRSFLRGSGLGLAAAGLGLSKVQAAAPAAAVKSRRLLRVAHLTDVHIQGPSEGCTNAEDGLRKALRHVQGLEDRPDFILFGGDLVMDSLGATKERALEQWALWERVISKELHLPAHHCLGNHDIWGWESKEPSLIEQDPEFGKAMALRRMGLSSSYYSFDQAGWRFVVLDSMQRRPSGQHGYFASLGEEQFRWLEQLLKATPREMQVCVVSHIPILGVCVFMDGELEKNGHWDVPAAWMHLDARRIKDLFARHPMVKLCVSGHIHLVDDVTYLGVRYLCNGAVCGGWWKGPYQEFGPACALLDLYEDGHAERRMVDYMRA
jgi:3',5'-cyclic AMP phosphodiesterase CpdA